MFSPMTLPSNTSMLLLYLLLGFLSCAPLNIGFYFNGPENEILIDNYDFSTNGPLLLKVANSADIPLTSPQSKLSPSSLMTQDNMVKDYTSKAEDGTFTIQYHEITLNETVVNLINVTYYASSTLFNEILFDVPSDKESYVTYPNGLEEEFIIGKCVKCSTEGGKRRKKKVSDIFGFSFETSENIEGEIEKVFLVANHKNKLAYYADMSSLMYRYDANQITLSEEESSKLFYDFYLEEMPEKFDLIITYSVKENIESDLAGKKILIVKKDIKHPDFGVNKENPNFTMFIVSMSLISVALVLTVIGIVVKGVIG